MSDTFRLLREAFPETLADSSVDVAIRRLQHHQAEAAKAILFLHDGLKRLVSPETDWENGEVGVGHVFRGIVWKILNSPEHAAAIQRAREGK